MVMMVRKAGMAMRGLVPVDARGAGDHEGADEDEGGRGGEGGDGADDRGDEDGEKEEQAGGDGGDAGASAGGDTRRRFRCSW